MLRRSVTSFCAAALTFCVAALCSAFQRQLEVVSRKSIFFLVLRQKKRVKSRC